MTNYHTPQSDNDATGRFPYKSAPGEEKPYFDTLNKLGSSFWVRDKAGIIAASDYFWNLRRKVTFYEDNAQAWQNVLLGGQIKSIQDAMEQAEQQGKQIAQHNAELAQKYYYDCQAYQQQAEDAVRSLEQQRISLENDIEQRKAEYLQEANAVVQRIKVLKSELSNLQEKQDLEEVGLYEYDNPAKQSIRLKKKLDEIKDDIKYMIKNDQAISGSGASFTFNNSASKGQKFTKDFGKLLLRAYNQEVENAIYRLDKTREEHTAVNRIEKAFTQTARLGEIMSMSIEQRYHELRLQEVRIGFQYKNALTQQKIEEAEHRAELREQEKAEREARSELEKIAKQQRELERQLEAERQRLLQHEQAHYSNVLNKLEEEVQHDVEESELVQQLRLRLAELEASKSKASTTLANTKAGYVYVISNVGSFGERVVKIGLTRRQEPLDRVKELGDASVPFRFDVHAIHFSDNAVELERSLHKKFAHFAVNKINHRKEFFRVSPADVRDAMMEISNGALLEFNEEPEAEEYRETLLLEGNSYEWA